MAAGRGLPESRRRWGGLPARRRCLDPAPRALPPPDLAHVAPPEGGERSPGARHPPPPSSPAPKRARLSQERSTPLSERDRPPSLRHHSKRSTLGGEGRIHRRDCRARRISAGRVRRQDGRGGCAAERGGEDAPPGEEGRGGGTVGRRGERAPPG
ncbi:uncharacterized protein [Miscanthus floridulus]|uniref:uncharacterized protein n=1 Tax=Miscanthus floridulus TaxID=154761 RepID=UPI003459A72B